jgi:RNA 3'-terminal phosphate cyclase (ATP)
MLTIDGSLGEGGGQILRTALGLSLVTGLGFRIHHLRAGRPKPGLQAQHLAAVQAAAAVGQAQVQGAVKGALELEFQPQAVTPGDYHFSVGTAGSTTLVLQTLLPALMTARGPSALVLEGGTHNPLAPPFEFLARTYLPLIHRMGPKVRVKLDRHGFYPAGGGKLRVSIEPSPKLSRLDLVERGGGVRLSATALVAHLPMHVAERELKVLKRELDLDAEALRTEEVKSHGPGNVVFVEIESAGLVEVFTGFGAPGVRAEAVAHQLAKEVKRYLAAEVPVGEHLADQLLVPLALAGGGSFVTLPLSSHALTNIEVIKLFLPVEVTVDPVSENAVRVCVTRRGDPSSGAPPAEPASRTPAQP